MAALARPKSAAPTYNFGRSIGPMAVPAGVPGVFGAKPTPETFAYAASLKQALALQEHALKRFVPYAQTASPGWAAPGLEADVKPKASMTGAGVVSAGCIDNTYLVKPLNNGWGKARERMVNEVFKPPHKQATDLLLVAKGAKGELPKQGLDAMESVRPSYSKTIPLFHPIDPQRSESGFVRPPNTIPGAAPPPQSAMLGIHDTPTVPADHALRKLQFDQSMQGQGRVPVQRVVRHISAQARPSSAAPAFLRRPAGLPGGLSLIQAE